MAAEQRPVEPEQQVGQGSGAMDYTTMVDHEKMDPYKVRATTAATTTSGNAALHGFTVYEESRGESAFVWDEGDRLRAGVIEGLGTKNLVADEVDAAHPGEPSKYYAIAQDSMAMIANDLVASGALPQFFWVHTSAGSSDWFTDERTTGAFIDGCRDVCDDVGATWGGGESPTLKGILLPDAAEISGFMLGEIRPRENYVQDGNLEEGDRIIVVPSSGIHANGLTAAREIADQLPERYDTLLEDGTSYGEALLQPTVLYVDAVRAIQEAGIRVKRFENITGHGWRKFMRSTQEFTYRMHTVPEGNASIQIYARADAG